MASISINDLATSEDLDSKACAAVRGGAFIFGWIVPFESIGRSSGGGSVVNFLIDDLVINNVTNTSIIDVDITEVNDSSVSVEAPVVQLGSQQTSLTEFFG